MDVGDHDCVHILPVCACTCMRLYVRHMHIRYEVCLTSYHIGTGLCTPVSVPLPIRYTPVSAPVSTLTSTPATVPASTPACTAAYTLASKYMSGGWAWTCEVCLSAMGMSPILLGNHRIGLAGKARTKHLFAGYRGGSALAHCLSPYETSFSSHVHGQEAQRWVLTDEVGGVGGPEEVGQVQPLDECRVHGDGLAPAPRIVCRWRVCIRAPDVLSLSHSAGLQSPGAQCPGNSFLHLHTFTQSASKTHLLSLGISRAYRSRASSTFYVYISQA